MLVISSQSCSQNLSACVHDTSWYFGCITVQMPKEILWFHYLGKIWGDSQFQINVSALLEIHFRRNFLWVTANTPVMRPGSFISGLDCFFYKVEKNYTNSTLFVIFSKPAPRFLTSQQLESAGIIRVCGQTSVLDALTRAPQMNFAITLEFNKIHFNSGATSETII